MDFSTFIDFIVGNTVGMVESILSYFEGRYAI